MTKRRMTLGLVIVLLIALAVYLQTTMKETAEKGKPYTLAYYEMNETEHVGDNSKVVGLIDQLPYANERKAVEIDTEGKGVRIQYERPKGETEDEEVLFHQAVLFQMIHNLMYVEYAWSDTVETVTKEEMQTMYHWSGKRLKEEEFQQKFVQPIRNDRVKRKEG